jgi:hypothetical protein
VTKTPDQCSFSTTFGGRKKIERKKLFFCEKCYNFFAHERRRAFENVSGDEQFLQQTGFMYALALCRVTRSVCEKPIIC